MYKEGRQIVVDAKKEIEGVVKDLKSVRDDTKGIWSFFKNLFGGTESPARTEVVEENKAPVKKAKKAPPPEFDENLIYQQVSDSLIKFLEAYNGLKNYIKEQEELALHVTDEKGNEIAIKLVIADLQMEKLNEDLREYMVYHVPAELKDLYTRVNTKIGQIANVQALARREELLKQRRARWRRQQKADLIQDRMVVTVATLLVLLWMWLMILSLTHSPSY